MLQQKEFLKKYNISKEDFTETKLEWKMLEKIYNEYLSLKNDYENTAKYLVEQLLSVKKVHSVKYRIKDPEHLIEKIIRKKRDNPEREFTLENYKEQVDDLIWIRALHLYKSDWVEIGDFIEKTWTQKDLPIAYIRKWDADEIIDSYKKHGYTVELHKHWYRSVHYVIETSPTRSKYSTEIQVRTIFEEWWSEIDHDIRYPYNLDDTILWWYLYMFNGISWNADEMGTFIKSLQWSLLKQQFALREKDDLLQETIAGAKKLEQKISTLENGNPISKTIKSDFSKLSRNFDKINNFNELDYFSYTNTDYSKKCDRCWKGQNFSLWTFYSGYNQFHTCPSCNRYLCNNCWSHDDNLDTLSLFKRNRLNSDKCPDCVKQEN